MKLYKKRCIFICERDSNGGVKEYLNSSCVSKNMVGNDKGPNAVTLYASRI